jgi:hypothetical protein
VSCFLLCEINIFFLLQIIFFLVLLRSEQPHFDGAFIAKDADVHSFVEDIMSKQKSVGQIFVAYNTNICYKNELWIIMSLLSITN